MFQRRTVCLYFFTLGLANGRVNGESMEVIWKSMIMSFAYNFSYFSQIHVCLS